MSKKINRIGILTSGGDAPGMNPAIRAVVRTARFNKIECLGIRRGFNGLINGDCFELDGKVVSELGAKGGTMLYTARCKEFITEEGQKKAASVCQYLGIDAIITIGGDGTFRGARDLAAKGVPCIGIPATIDNDIACTNYSIGFDSAANTAIECIDKLRDTMQSHERCSVVEVMGRNAGHLALYVGIAVGATTILIPEIPVDFESDVAEKIRRARIAGRTHFLIIVAEGVGNLNEIADQIRESTGIDPRVTIIGHIQRGGSPTARDRVYASRMGKLAVEILLEGRYNRIVCQLGGETVDLDMVEALEMQRGLQQSMIDTAVVMTSGYY